MGGWQLNVMCVLLSSGVMVQGDCAIEARPTEAVREPLLVAGTYTGVVEVQPAAEPAPAAGHTGYAGSLAT